MQSLGSLLLIYKVFNLFYLDLIVAAVFLLYVVYSFARPRAGQRFLQRLPLASIFLCLLLTYSHLSIRYSPEFYFYMDREDLCIDAVGHISEPVIFQIDPPKVTCKKDDGSLVELIPSWFHAAVYFLQYATIIAFLVVCARWIWLKLRMK